MAWMLQPHNWTQAVRPNLYNIAYKRNLAYKGMGQLPPAPPLAMTYSGTPPSMTTSYWRLRGLGQACDPLTQSAIDQGLVPASACPGYGGGGSGGGTQVQQINTTTWILIGGAMLLLLLVVRR